MSPLDDLFAESRDERVRRTLAAEVKKLREGKKLVLAFENTLPESSKSYGGTVKACARIVNHAAKGAAVFWQSPVL